LSDHLIEGASDRHTARQAAHLANDDRQLDFACRHFFRHLTDTTARALLRKKWRGFC
jgi:hypothetical protein